MLLKNSYCLCGSRMLSVEKVFKRKLSVASATVSSDRWIPPSFAFWPQVMVQSWCGAGPAESTVAVWQIANVIKFKMWCLEAFPSVRKWECLFFSTVQLLTATMYRREYAEANITTNLYVVSQPWLYSLAWCSGVHSVTTNAPQLLSTMTAPLFLMVTTALLLCGHL